MDNFNLTMECQVPFSVYLSMFRLHISLTRTTAMEPVKMGRAYSLGVNAFDVCM
jgi:hypothetical protein